MATLRSIDYVVITAYFIAMILIGFLSVRKDKQKDSKSFLLGGGKLPYFALGISCLMASLSAFSIVMVPGEIFNHGLSMFVLGLFTPLVSILACSIFLRFYFKLGSFTPFAYLEYRYSPAVRSLVAGLGLYSSMTYLGMVLFSTSKIFLGAAGWSPWLSIVLIGGVSLAFTSAGGLKAVVWTDVMQFIVLIGGLFCILFFLFWKIDGGVVGAISTCFREGHGIDEYFKPSFYKLSPYNRLSFWILLFSMLVGGVSGAVTNQMGIQRMLASGNLRNAVKTQTVNAIFTIPTSLILWIIGIGVFTYYFQNQDFKPASGDTALFTFISTQIPSPIPGLILAGMLAAVISTLNAAFNSMATIYVKEFHVRYFNPELTEDRQVRLSRIATIIVGVLAIGQGLLVTLSSDWLRQSVIEASTIFSIFNAIILPAFLYAIFSKRASTMLVWVASGLLWGMKIGTITWYMLSTNAVNRWQEGMPLGYGGPIGFTIPVCVFVAGLLAIFLWNHLRDKTRPFHTFLMTLPTMITGFGAGLIIWAISSNLCIGDTPRAVSFQWLGVPADILYILLGIIWLNVGEIQPKEKWQGMILFET
ncbi:MAG: hypothetical protein GX946_07400 [Oligosphaeraceae bacterium]|nr:hypothetical protein [Oligosphaeraceae bacterium]